MLLELMRQLLIAALVWLAFAHSSLAAVDAEGYNEYTIRPSDVPSDAPRFEDYPAKPYRGSNATPDLRSHRDSREYRTRLRAWAEEKPNFAGHYILANWGCGTDCTRIAIIDARSGKIFHPRGATTNEAVNIHHALLGGGNVVDLWHGTGAVWHRVDSKLLVLIGAPEGNYENRGISYFVWDDNKLTRVRFVHRPWYPREK
jgi:hypothetical protein